MYMYGNTCTCELTLYTITFPWKQKVHDYLIACENIIVIGFLYKMMHLKCKRSITCFKWLIFAYTITYNYQRYKIGKELWADRMKITMNKELFFPFLKYIMCIFKPFHSVIHLLVQLPQF